MSILGLAREKLTRPITSHSSLVFLLGIILIAGLWLFVWLRVSSEYDDAIEDSSRETMNLAIGFEEHVRRIIADADKSLLMLRSAYEKEGVDGPIVNDLLVIEGKDPSVAQVAVDNGQGVVVAAFDRRAIGNDNSDREYFQWQRGATTDALGIGKPVVGRASREEAIPLTRRITGDDGSFAGITLIALKTEYLLEFYKKLNLGQDQLITLVGQDWVVRARRFNDNMSSGQSVAGSALWQHTQYSQAGTYMAKNQVDGILRITSYRVMADYPLIIVVGKSAQVALVEYERRKYSYIYGAALTSLIILVFCLVLVKRHEIIRQQNVRLRDSEEELLAQNEELQAKEEVLLAQNEELQAKEEELLAQNEELQAKEAALFNSKERYKTLLTQLSEGIIISEYPTMKIVEANNNATNMFGYTEAELLTMSAYDLDPEGMDKLQPVIGRLLEKTVLPPEVHSFRHKDGYIVYAELAGSLIEHLGKKLFILSYRDTSEERKFHEQIRSEVELAGKVQKAMLAGDYEDEKIAIKTVYEPIHLISGDYYGYHWVRGGSLLNGFLLDVTGHGMATALQTAAVSAILHEEMEKEHPWSEEALLALNSLLAAYLPENSYAAVLTFSFDFRKRELTCISAGINYFLASSRKHLGWVSLPGSFLGNSDFASFYSITIPLQHGDSFCFVTDGLLENLVPVSPMVMDDFAGIYEKMNARAVRADRLDDCTAFCLEVKAFASWPMAFEYAGPENRKHVLQRVQQALADIVGENDFSLELALGEAEANAYRHGSKVRIRLNKVGSRLIIRVANSGPGFPGNEAVRKIRAAGIRETFEALVEHERGRGIPIMLSLMDRVLYNRYGTEVMLIKVLSAEKTRGGIFNG